ncbi:MAG: TetR/AcrR family transcriptional regulator [Bacteroidales bacterium]|jgi:AcrR family transcriptional regulator|nr:TetR/AcrR family transcriptional regulator [Bacteroidales bacterium]
MKSTKQDLIDAARNLFSIHGYTNTTMNDIANESKKGRRTLYTYFKNKKEIINAIIDEELSYVVSSLESIAAMNIDPLEKLTKFVVTRMESVREIVIRNGSLHAEFFKNTVNVELFRRKFEKKEINLLERIFSEGVEKKVFNISSDSYQAAVLTHFIMQGLDVPYIRGILDESNLEKKEALKKKMFLIIKGLINDDLYNENKI